MPVGRLSRVKPAGTTTDGTNTRKVLMCGAPFWSTNGGLTPSLISVGWCSTALCTMASSR